MLFGVNSRINQPSVGQERLPLGQKRCRGISFILKHFTQSTRIDTSWRGVGTCASVVVVYCTGPSSHRCAHNYSTASGRRGSTKVSGRTHVVRRYVCVTGTVDVRSNRCTSQSSLGKGASKKEQRPMVFLASHVQKSCIVGGSEK